MRLSRIISTTRKFLRAMLSCIGPRTERLRLIIYRIIPNFLKMFDVTVQVLNFYNKTSKIYCKVLNPEIRLFI